MIVSLFDHFDIYLGDSVGCAQSENVAIVNNLLSYNLSKSTNFSYLW